MGFKRVHVISLVCLLGVCGAPLRAQGNTQFFPLRDLRPGMKGVGRTTFQGNTIQQFQVNIVGVLRNFLAPKQNVILARLSGPTVQDAGVAAGMSGSPVYIDGKLLGAVAEAFPFAKEPYTLITPIEDMLQVAPSRSVQGSEQAVTSLPWYSASSLSGSGVAGRWIPASGTELLSRLRGGSQFSGSWPLSQALTPLSYSGFDPRVISEFRPRLQSIGFEPQGAAVVSASGATASGSPGGSAADVVPGSMIDVVLVRGDLNLSEGCTVTYRQGNSIYACGHRLFALGSARLPFAVAHVLATVPSLQESFKVDAIGPVVGSIRQDRYGAIYGVLGENPPVIPVNLTVNSSLDRTQNYQFEVAQQPLLSPLLVNLVIVSALSSTERGLGPSTLDLSGKIRLSDGEAVNLQDMLSSDAGSIATAGLAVAEPLSFLLDGQYPNLRIEGIDLKVNSQDESRVATLVQVWSSESEVRPGDNIQVTTVERTPSGERLSQTIPVDIPENVNDKTLSLEVGSGSAINAMQLHFLLPGHPPQKLQQLVRELNRKRRNNRIYALLMSPQRAFVMDGTDFPSPPPSLLRTFIGDPAVSNKITYRPGSVVGDFETQSLLYTIRGAETLYLKVLRAAN